MARRRGGCHRPLGDTEQVAPAPLGGRHLEHRGPVLPEGGGQEPGHDRASEVEEREGSVPSEGVLVRGAERAESATRRRRLIGESREREGGGGAGAEEVSFRFVLTETRPRSSAPAPRVPPGPRTRPRRAARSLPGRAGLRPALPASGARPASLTQ